jgi:maltodextrin utilization protein YvdJ
MARDAKTQVIFNSSVLPAALAALAIGIFIIDTLTDLEIAVAVFYVAVVLISVGIFRKRGVMLVSAGCIGLTS